MLVVNRSTTLRLASGKWSVKMWTGLNWFRRFDDDLFWALKRALEVIETGNCHLFKEDPTPTKLVELSLLCHHVAGVTEEEYREASLKTAVSVPRISCSSSNQLLGPPRGGVGGVMSYVKTCIHTSIIIVVNSMHNTYTFVYN
jgi:hypothetical protein